MREAVLGSKLISEFGNRGWLERRYDEMHLATRWRLFSAALWEREFSVA
jgi:hypothetical protein